MMKTILFFTVASFWIKFACCQSLAPEVISSAGNYYDNGTVSLSWTLGESVTETVTDGNTILTQGFQQSRYDIVAVENIEQNLNISLYPNPTSQYLNLDWEIPGENSIIVELVDMTGKTLVSKSYKETKSQKQINLSTYPAAEYFVKVSSGSNILKTYKVTKF